MVAAAARPSMPWHLHLFKGAPHQSGRRASAPPLFTRGLCFLQGSGSSPTPSPLPLQRRVCVAIRFVRPVLQVVHCICAAHQIEEPWPSGALAPSWSATWPGGLWGPCSCLSFATLGALWRPEGARALRAPPSLTAIADVVPGVSLPVPCSWPAALDCNTQKVTCILLCIGAVSPGVGLGTCVGQPTQVLTTWV